jgi:hypothetical protein
MVRLILSSVNFVREIHIYVPFQNNFDCRFSFMLLCLKKFTGS